MRARLFMSASLNGMIARPTGRGDFFSDICWHGFVEVVREAGGLIWGRATHDFIRGWSSFRRDLSGSPVRGVVLTRATEYPVEPSWETAGSPREALRRLTERGIERAVVAGGTRTNSAFVSEGLVDGLTLFVESTVVPSGLPLFEADLGDIQFRLTEARRVTGRVARLDLALDPYGRPSS